MTDEADRTATDDAQRTRAALESVPYGIRVAGAWSGYLLLISAGIALIFWAIGKLGVVSVSFVTAVMIAALLQPLVSWFVRRGIPRGWSAVLGFFTGAAALGLLFWFVIASVMGSSDEFSRQIDGALRGAKTWLMNGPAHLDAATASKYTTDLGQTVSQHSGDLTGQLSSHAGQATGAITAFILTLVCILFLLADDGRIWRWCVSILPKKTHDYVDLGGAAAWKTLVVYMRSLVLLAVLNAAAMLPIMWLADVPLAIPLTVALFLGSLIPLVGVLLAAVLLFAIAFIAKGIVTAIVMMIALTLVIQLFGNLLNPIILGKFVDLHPLVILLGVTAGTVLGGTFGAFTAVPLIAVVNNMVRVMRHLHAAREAGLETEDLDYFSERKLEQLAEESL